jgi:outer membrane protein TolC
LDALIFPASVFLLGATGYAQSGLATASSVPPLAASAPFLLAKSPFADFIGTASSRSTAHEVIGMIAALPSSPSSAAPGLPRKLTLKDAQQAAASNNPMARLEQLGLEASHQHTLGAEADYFPKINVTAANFHFNKFMGQEIVFQRPVDSGTVTTGLPLLGKDQTLVSLTAAQPITPILKVQQGAKVARADERTAMARSGMPVEAADDVEKDYYDLLVAERELDIAKVNADLVSSKRLVASIKASADSVPGDTPSVIDAEKELVLAETKVKQLTESLNSLLGFPADTELELVVPEAGLEDISLKEAMDEATTANPEVVAAEADLVKARAGRRLAKLDYVPDIAILGGYVYNGNAAPLLPTDFSYIGVLGSWTVWDWGKREHTVKEHNAQLGMAETAVQLTKAKAAGEIKNSYYEMDRSRQLSDLAHRLNNAVPVERASYSKENPELTTTRAKIEIEMLQADLVYRKSLSQLKTLMGNDDDYHAASANRRVRLHAQSVDPHSCLRSCLLLPCAQHSRSEQCASRLGATPPANGVSAKR